MVVLVVVVLLLLLLLQLRRVRLVGEGSIGRNTWELLRKTRDLLVLRRVVVFLANGRRDADELQPRAR